MRSVRCAMDRRDKPDHDRGGRCTRPATTSVSGPERRNSRSNLMSAFARIADRAKLFWLPNFV